jgi:hypothetical protein
MTSLGQRAPSAKVEPTLRRDIVSDPEIDAMGEVAAALSRLDDDDARARVLRWAADRYSVWVTPAATMRPSSAMLDGSAEDKPQQIPDPRDAIEPTFGQFVDLFDAIDPKSDVDKALTAAYWLQIVSKQSSWQSLRVNNLLKDMGHGVANVTSALRSAQERKPALVRQVHKSGRSPQSWKTYKLTTSGVSYMRRKLGLAQAVPAAFQDHDEDAD